MIASFVQMAETVVALIFVCVLGVAGEVESVSMYRDVMAFEVAPDNWGGVSLGGLIIGRRRHNFHEYGHVLQRREYGPMQMLIIGLPSLASAIINPLEHGRQWTETDATRRSLDDYYRRMNL